MTKSDMNAPEKPPIIHYEDARVRARARWWRGAGALIVILFISATTACYWYCDPQFIGGGIYVCVCGFILAIISWCGLRYGTQNKDIWT